MTDNEKSYTEKVQQLNEILSKLDDSAIPIDELAVSAKKGAELIIDLQGQLKKVETEVQNAFELLDGAFDRVG